MKIERHRVGTVDVIAPCGPLVDQDVAVFASDLMQRVKAPNARVVVTLSEVPYLDSAAIEALVDAADELGQGARTLKLAAVSSTCREILELTGMAPRFAYFADVQDAVRSFL